jgi:hypothetical protein
MEMKDMMAILEQQLAQIIKSGKSLAAQAGIKMAIDDYRLNIEQLMAETQTNQAVYQDLVQEMRAKLEQRIKEVKD